MSLALLLILANLHGAALLLVPEAHLVDLIGWLPGEFGGRDAEEVDVL
ncbi:MAG: hypothetical protein H0T49_10515 [Chloroflexia bacterium]|nr:hypothetical protein [Chloroflexia bacterium]